MVIALVAVAASLSCKVEQAHYALRTASEITATFQRVSGKTDPSGIEDWPSHVAFRIHIGTTKRTYWFLPWNGGSDGQQHLASTTDVNSPNWKAPDAENSYERPLGDVDYIATDANYTLINAAPRSGEIAPAHILLPNLRKALWYRTEKDRRDASPKQFFDLVSCSH